MRLVFMVLWCRYTQHYDITLEHTLRVISVVFRAHWLSLLTIGTP